MAQVTKTTTTREVTTTVEEDVVVLTLTPEEAEVVRALTGHVGGNCGNDDQLRKAADAVWEALVDAGVEYADDRMISADVRNLTRY